MSFKRYGEFRQNNRKFHVLWSNVSDPAAKISEHNIKVLGKERLTVAVNTGEKDVVKNIVQSFVDNRPGIEENLNGKEVFVVYKETIKSASTAEVSKERKGWLYKIIEAIIGVKE